MDFEIKKKTTPRILVISGILPISAIDYKKTENDILLVTEEEISKRNEQIKFNYVFIFPYANWILSKLSPKWKSYFGLSKKATYPLQGRAINLFPVYLLPKKIIFRGLLIKLSMWRYKARLDEIITKFEPTVIHAHDTDTSGAIARYLSEKYKLPYIVTLRGLNKYVDKHVVENVKNATSLIAISSQQLMQSQKLIGKHNNLLFIPHGIDEKFFVSANYLKDINIPIRLVTIARLLKLKNIDLLINSLSTFDYDFEFHIYGNGPEMDELTKLVERLGLQDRIKLKGYIPNNDVSIKLKQYDVFMMPSFPESLGRVYFEAMASGLPVIASKNTGIDGIISDGKEGFLLQHNDKGQFAIELKAILKNFIDNPNQYIEMSRNARRFASNYSWNKIAPQYLLLYNDLRK